MALTFADANYRKLIPGGTQMRRGERQNDTGAFSATTTSIPIAGVRISSLDDGTGSGTGGGMVFGG